MCVRKLDGAFVAIFPFDLEVGDQFVCVKDFRCDSGVKCWGVAL